MDERPYEGRQFYLDNIKAIYIMSLFIWHTCEIFHSKEGFYIEGVDNFFLTFLYCFVSSWIMAAMFFISGISTMYSLEKRSVKQFYADRGKRILKPLVFGLLLWIPIGAFFTQKNHGSYSGNFFNAYVFFFTHANADMYGYDGSFSPAQLWYMCFLLAYTYLIYPFLSIIQRIKDKYLEMRVVSWRNIVIVILINWILSYGGTEETFLAFGMIFLLGMLLYKNSYFYSWTKKNWKVLLSIALLTNIGASLALIHIRDIENIWTAEYALSRLIWSIGRIMGVIATIGVSQATLNKRSRVFKYLTRNSYNYYFLHMQVVIVVAYFVIAYMTKTSVYVQGLVIFLSSIGITIIVVEVLKRIPFTRWLFELKK